MWPEEVAGWLAGLVPMPLRAASFDSWQVAYGNFNDGVALATTVSFHGLDAGLHPIGEPETSVRAEIMTCTHAGTATAVEAVVAAARFLSEKVGEVAAQPSTLLPDVLRHVPGTVNHAVLFSPALWGGKVPQLRKESALILPLELVALTDEEFEIAREQGAEKMLRRLNRRSTDPKDWERD